VDKSQAVAKHLRTVFGPPSRSGSFVWEQQDVAVYKWGAERTGEGVDLYATDGGTPPRSGTHTAEFFTGLTPGQDDVAGPLASLHRYQSFHDVMLGHGHTVRSEGPLWAGAALDSMLILSQATVIIPPLFTGDRHVEFLQMVPITTAERESVHSKGVGAFLEDWEARKVPFWDSKRADG
jgi:hypothetical protein